MTPAARSLYNKAYRASHGDKFRLHKILEGQRRGVRLINAGEPVRLPARVAEPTDYAKFIDTHFAAFEDLPLNG